MSKLVVNEIEELTPDNDIRLKNRVRGIDPINSEQLTTKNYVDSEIVNVGDNRYFQKTEFINTSTGAPDQGKPIVLDSTGKVDQTMIDQSNIDHTQIQNIGSNSHAQIDNHIASNSNPHNVTPSQVGNNVAQWNADKLQNNSISSATPNDKDYLVYDNLSSEWQPTAFNQNSVDHTQIQNIGVNTHAQIDSHIANVANPHNVTAAQVGNAIAQWNADKLQGENISITPPANKQVLTYNSSLSEWEPQDSSGSSNVVKVFQESDFGVAVGGKITLNPFGVYRILVQELITVNEIVIPDNSHVLIEGIGLNITNWIFAGASKTLFTCANMAQGSLYIRRMTLIDGTFGSNTLFNLTGHPTVSFPAELYSTLCIFYGWGDRGIAKNLSLVNFNESEHYNNGNLTLENIFAWSFNNYVSYNFYPNAQGVHFTIKTNINQANVSACAFNAAKGEAIFNIDPAINAESGISIGPATPFQGFNAGLIASFVDIGGGNVRVVCVNGHTFDNGDIVLIRFTSNYNGAFTVSNVIQFDSGTLTGTFDITAAFVADDAQGQAILLDGTSPKIEDFFKQGTIEPITQVTNDGGGLALFTTSGVAPTTGQSLFIKGTSDYDQGGFAVNVSPATFTLLDSFGIPVPHTVDNLGLTNAQFDTGSLDQTNNVVTTSNTGGIVPDSQFTGNAILTSTVAFASTTILTRVSAGTWASDEAERFKATDDGRLIYTGKTTRSVQISGKVIAQKQSGTASSAFVNFMIDVGGTGTFVEIPSHPATEPSDEIAIGFASDGSFTVDIFAIDLNIKG
jgi:hypothetical protein